MNPNPEPFDLACACKAGRILGGHDTGVPRWPLPALPKRGAPVTLEEIRHAAAIRAYQIEGTQERAARRLNISKTTFNDIMKRAGNKNILHSGKIVKLAACLLLLFTIARPGFGQVKGAQALITRQVTVALPALPKRTLTAVPQVKTNGVVTLKWSNGDPAETAIVNQTAGVVYPPTTNATLTVGGLAVGSRQTFVATNTAGASAPVTTVIAADSLTLKFSTWLYLTWAGPPGTLQTSTNTVIWRDVQPMPTGGGYIVTNSAARGFYRVKL